MKLRVVNLKGERISFIRSFLRYLSYILSALTLLIGFMLAGWTPRKRALHDFIAGTLVIKDEEYVPE